MSNTHEIEDGQTLWGLSRDILRNRGGGEPPAADIIDLIGQIKKLNADSNALYDGDRLIVGRTLVLPGENDSHAPGIQGQFAAATTGEQPGPASPLPEAIAEPAQPIQVPQQFADAAAGDLVNLKDPRQVNIIQEGLAALGYNPGPQDDIWGPRTKAALESWQRANGHAPGLPTPGQLIKLEQAAADPAAARAKQGALAAAGPAPAPRAYGFGLEGERIVKNAERTLKGQPPAGYYSLASAPNPQSVLVLDKGHFQRMAGGITDHGVHAPNTGMREVDLDLLSDDVARLLWEKHGIPVIMTRASGEAFFLGRYDNYEGKGAGHYGHLDGRAAFAEEAARQAGIPLDRVSLVSFHADSTSPSHKGPTLYTHPGDEGSARFAEVAARGLTGGSVGNSGRDLNILRRAEEGGLGAAAVLEVGNFRNKQDELRLQRIVTDPAYRLEVAREMAASIAKAHMAIQPASELQYADTFTPYRPHQVTPSGLG
jgi:peptidoglycan hydrolase-like protein with peptidoglycan-binding domain